MILKVSPFNVYCFKYEEGLTGTDIDFVDADNSVGAGNVQVGTRYGRTFVLKGDTPVAAQEFDIDHTGFDITSTGAIEFLTRADAVNDDEDCYVALYDGATLLVTFFFDVSTENYYYNIGGGNQLIYNGSGHNWRGISIRIDIDAGINGQFDCYIYDNEWTELANVTGIEFQNNATTVDKLRIYGAGADVGSWYFDNFGITGEGSYTLGDIQYVDTDLSAYISSIIINDGILPIQKMCAFEVHPDYQAYFNIEDFIDIFDNSSNLIFTGRIIDKSRNNRGIYQFECDGMANEIFDRTYDVSWSSNDTDTKQKAVIDNALQFCYRSSSITTDPSTNYSYDYNRECSYIFQLGRFLERQVAYIAPDGKLYTVSHDDLVATGKSWTLNDGNQNAILKDIRGFNEGTLQGYYKGNNGITRTIVRYMNNTTVTRPSTPTETFIKGALKEWIDYNLQTSTEAAQLATNLYNIFSAETIFLGFRIEGEGWLQPGKTIQIDTGANDQIVITQDDFLILRFKYDPQNDVYEEMILSDNIIFPKEFLTKLDTSRQQVHTTAVQAAINQAYTGGSSATYLEYDDDDLNANDIDHGDLTIDSSWHELDMDNYKTVPSDAIGCFVNVLIRDTAAGDLSIGFRHTSQSNAYQVSYASTIDNGYSNHLCIIPLDTNHKFDYMVENGMDNVYIRILWWIHQPSIA